MPLKAEVYTHADIVLAPPGTVLGFYKFVPEWNRPLHNLAQWTTHVGYVPMLSLSHPWRYRSPPNLQMFEWILDLVLSLLRMRL